jgi:hypothetical protein
MKISAKLKLEKIVDSLSLREISDKGRFGT